MKKVLVALLLLFFPIVVFAKDDVSIESVSLAEKSEDAKELSEATFSGMNLNVHTSFAYKNDFVKYRVVIKNNTKKDYSINANEDNFQKGENLSYTFKFDGNNNIVKANSSIIMYLTITYKKEVAQAAFQNGVYEETNSMNFHLSSENNVTNPVTGRLQFLLILVAIVTTVAFFIALTNEHYFRRLYYIIPFILLIPLLVYAVEELNIKVDSKVEIRYEKKFCLKLDGSDPRNPVTSYYSFVPGTIFNDYDFDITLPRHMRFEYKPGYIDKNNINLQLALFTDNQYTDFSTLDFYEVLNSLPEEKKYTFENLYDMYNGFLYNFQTFEIMDKSVGCYVENSK